MQLHQLALKRARHHPFTQSLGPVHLGPHQTAPVVAAPDAPPKMLAGSHGLVSVGRSKAASFPKTGVFARLNHSLRSWLGNRIKAAPRVIRTVRTDAVDDRDVCYLHRQWAGWFERHVVLRPVRRAVAYPHLPVLTHPTSLPSASGGFMQQNPVQAILLNNMLCVQVGIASVRCVVVEAVRIATKRGPFWVTSVASYR